MNSIAFGAPGPWTYGPVILFYGWIGWVTVIAACIGTATVLAGIEGWLSARFALVVWWWVRVAIGPSGRKIGSGWFGWDLWIGIPRRFRVHRRWDRPGAMVNLGDGRQGAILWVTIDPDAGGMAIVQPYDDDGQAQQPEWAALGSLSPLPRHVTIASAS